MDERLRKAFDFAADATKLLISLSTGIIAVGVTFSKDVAKGPQVAANHLLFAGWIAYLLSIAFGILTMLSLTANLEPKAAPVPGQQLPAPSIWAPNVVLFSIAQILGFILATALVIAHAILNL